MPAPGALILLAAVSTSGCLASPAHPGIREPGPCKPGPQPSPVPTDGFALGRAPLAPPYAVVLISCSGLLAFIFLLLTCLCCKRGDVGFKVILGEIFSDYTPAQVVVKELRASAGPLEQRKFISEAQPYRQPPCPRRSLQHPNVLQCLGVCVETLPFLLIMEFCQLGDLKRYLRAQRPPEGLSPELPPRDLRTLQRMGLEIARGLAHLHSHNYVHSYPLLTSPPSPAPSDLALRNCLLTSDLTVRIGDYGLAHSNYKPTFVVQVSTEQLLMSLREDVTRKLLGEKGAAARDTGPRRAGRGPGNRERAPGPSRGPTVLDSGKQAPSPNGGLSLRVNGVTVLENGEQRALGVEEKAAENGSPGSPEREEQVLANGELPPPRREEKVLENGGLGSPEREEQVLVNGGLTPPKIEEVSENGGLRLPRNPERLPETGPWRAPGPWEKMPESGAPAPMNGEPAPETLLERALAPGAVALALNGGETAPGPIGPAPRSGVPEPGTERRALETGGAPRAPGAGRLDLGSGVRAPVGMGMAPGGGLGSGVDAKAGWVDSTRPQPPPPPLEAQPTRPEPAPQRARPEAASEGEPGVPDSRAGGDTAPNEDGDPPKPERKGPEMPRLFLDLGPPQGNSEQIKAKLSRLSLALPPLTLTPFPGPGPRRPPWEGVDAGAAGGEAGGAGASGPSEEDGEDEDEDEEEDEEAAAAGAVAGPRGPGRARAAPVPVVVSSADADAARPLRGLLKSPRGADEPEDSELERKRKMVSFHGDVTVYLFDQ
eukprot:bmy_06429T0